MPLCPLSLLSSARSALGVLAFTTLSVLSAQAQMATVQGFVTDASDGQALQGVNVAVIDAMGDLRGGVTNDDGFFIIIRLHPGRYILRVSYVG